MAKPSKGLKLVNGIWHIDIRDEQKKRIRESTWTEDLEKAEQRLAQLKTEIFERRYVPQAQKQAELTLQQGFDKTMKLQWSSQKSHKTPQYNYNRLIGVGEKKDMIRHLDPDTKLSEISTAMIWEAIESLRDVGYTDASINRSMSVVRTVLTNARDEWEVLDKAPRIPHFREGNGRLRWLQDGEEEHITGWFRAKGDSDMAELIEVLLDTGCRLSEILGLEPSTVRLFSRDILLWDTKNGDWDVQPLTERSLQIFTRRYKLAGSPFEGLTRHAAIHRFQTMKKHCGYETDEELCLHTMRHTTASRLVQLGVDIKRVQQFMRHKDINTTLRYAKLNPEEKARTAKVLEFKGNETCPKLDQNVSELMGRMVRAA